MSCCGKNPRGRNGRFKRNPDGAGARSPTRTATRTATEVRSPTSTEVRSPTSTTTSTEADTAGNITVTGGAGRGATTTVKISGFGPLRRGRKGSTAKSALRGAAKAAAGRTSGVRGRSSSATRDVGRLLGERRANGRKRKNPSPVRGLAKTRKRRYKGKRPKITWMLRQSKGYRRGCRFSVPATRKWWAKKHKKNPLLQVVLPNRKGRKRKNPLTRAELSRLQESDIISRIPIASFPWVRGSRKSMQIDRAVAALRAAKRKRNGRRKTTRNPLITGRNPRARGEQRLTVGGFVSKKVASTHPGFQRALELHRKFHGREPVHFTRVRLEDGQAHVTRKAVVMIGEAPAIEYRTWKHADSKKSYTKDGRRITWRHKMGEDGGKPAYYVHDPLSGVTSLLGGTYRIAGRPAFYHN